MSHIEMTDPAQARRVSRSLRFLRSAGMCLAALPWGIALFTILITGVALGAGLAITFVGIPILAWTLHLGGLSASLEGHAASWSPGVQFRSQVPPGPRTWAECWTLIRDPAAWDDLARGVMRLPFGILSFTVTVVLLTTSVAYMAAPLVYQWAGIWTLTGEVETLGDAFLAVPQGIVIATVAAYVIPRMASLMTRLSARNRVEVAM